MQPNMCGSVTPKSAVVNPAATPAVVDKFESTTADQLKGLDLSALDGYLRSFGIER